MNRLLEIGFTPAGHWLLADGTLTFELERFSTQKNILYAFVSDGEVKYVGKTIRTLSTRMGGYKMAAPGQSTNIKNHQKIRELLEAGAVVDILALPDSGLMHYGPFHLNLAAALEDSIIKVLQPSWNGGRSEPTADQATGSEEADQPVKHKFSFTLHPTYYRTGFFNVTTTDQAWFGADGETIEIFLGNAEQPVLGSINRRANQNSTPRIMGGTAVRDWLQANCVEGIQVQVEVYSGTSIRLVQSTGRRRP